MAVGTLLCPFLACTQPVDPAVPICVLAGMVIFPCAIRSVLSRSSWRIHQEASADCSSCGYDLSGLPAESACPECGTPASHRGRPIAERDPIPGAWLDLFLAFLPCLLYAKIPWTACYLVYRLHGVGRSTALQWAENDSEYPITAAVISILALLLVLRCMRRCAAGVRRWITGMFVAVGALGTFWYWCGAASHGIGPWDADSRLTPSLLIVMFVVAIVFCILAEKPGRTSSFG